MRVQGHENKERICLRSRAKSKYFGMPISYRLVIVGCMYLALVGIWRQGM